MDVIETEVDNQFYLTDDIDFDLEWAKGVFFKSLKTWVFFQESVHTFPPGRPCYIIICGAKALSNVFRVAEDAQGVVTFGAGLDNISSDGLEAVISFRDTNGEETCLFSGNIASFDVEEPWYKRELNLESVLGKTGKLVIECKPGPENKSAADWLALYELVICRKKEFKLWCARAFMKIKEKNEISIYSATYSHDIYNESESK